MTPRVMTPRDDARITHLRDIGASQQDAEELLRYAENRFVIPPALPGFPLPDEPFVDVWRGYAASAAAAGSIDPLRSSLVQLAFPISAGISQDPAYQAATLTGVLPSQAFGSGGLALHSPDNCQISIHQSPAGAIGVLTAARREDFENLVRAFTAKNEPVEVRSSMGALMVGGYNNWHRIRLRKEEFLRAGGRESEWPREFARLKTDKDLYQDRFILLSNGPYSGVTARDLGLDEDEWIARSWTIRLEHESAHYFTRRVFGSMRNNLLDEVMADYAGLRQAFGSFRAGWLLRFLGLEDYPRYREGGRLQNYRGSPPLGDGAFAALMRLVWQVALNLEQFDRSAIPGRSLAADLAAIASMTIDELAARDTPWLLAERCAAIADRQREEWTGGTGNAARKAAGN